MADNRTVFLVNTFIAHTVLLLNNFSAVCEDKLADVHLRILRLEATTTLLEAKLDSVARSRGEAVTMREAVAKGKEMGARFAGTQDLVRVFNRALELLNSNTPESDQELLELVKKSKREIEKESSVPPAKKARRGPSEVGDFQALGHRPNLATLTGDHGSGQSGSGSEGTPTQSTSGTSASVAHAQVRPIQIIRNPGRGGGRGEKHKRKSAR